MNRRFPRLIARLCRAFSRSTDFLCFRVLGPLADATDRVGDHLAPPPSVRVVSVQILPACQVPPHATLQPLS